MYTGIIQNRLNSNPRALHIDDDKTNAMLFFCRARIGLDRHPAPACSMSTTCPDLLPVEYIFISILDRAGLYIGEVRSGVGLAVGSAPYTIRFSGSYGREIFFTLFFTAKIMRDWPTQPIPLTPI